MTVFFSVSIINNFDLDKNGSFDSNEVNEIEENAFSNLWNYGYFIYLGSDDKRYNPDNISNFSAELHAGSSLVLFIFFNLM